VQPIRDPFKAMVNVETIEKLWEARITKPGEVLEPALLDELDQKMTAVLQSIISFNGYKKVTPVEKITSNVHQRLEASLQLLQSPTASSIKLLEKDKIFWGALFGWLFVHALGEITPEPHSAARSRSWIDEWLLARIITNALKPLELNDYEANQAATAVKVMTMHQKVFEGQKDERADTILNTLLQDSDAQQFLRLNRYQNVMWFDKDSFEQLLRWLQLMPVVAGASARIVDGRTAIVEKLTKAQAASSYQVEKLRAGVKEPTKAKASKAPKTPKAPASSAKKK
jgi:hypothetical protein